MLYTLIRIEIFNVPSDLYLYDDLLTINVGAARIIDTTRGFVVSALIIQIVVLKKK